MTTKEKLDADIRAEQKEMQAKALKENVKDHLSRINRSDVEDLKKFIIEQVTNTGQYKHLTTLSEMISLIRCAKALQESWEDEK